MERSKILEWCLKPEKISQALQKKSFSTKLTHNERSQFTFSCSTSRKASSNSACRASDWCGRKRGGSFSLDYFIPHFIELLPNFMLDKNLSHYWRNPVLLDGIGMIDNPSLPTFIDQLRRTFHLAHVATEHVRPDFIEGNQPYFPC